MAAYTFAVVATVIAAGSGIRLPAYSIGPGPARDVASLVRTRDAPTYKSAGSFLLTTVSVSGRQLSVWEGLWAWIDPSQSLIEREYIVRPGLSDDKQELINRHEMEESKLAARIVAARALGRPVRRLPGAAVFTVVPGTPAEGTMKPGDRIVAVDGKRAADPEEVIRLVRDRKIGDPIRLTVERAGKTRRFRFASVESFLERGKASAGATIGPAFRLPLRVDINTGLIGGPSGGLVFALAVADLFTPDDLTRGHSIAATGTIAVDGEVGAVGGVSKKVQAAEHAGADVFLVPAGEVDEARSGGTEMRVVGVRTFEEAIKALRALPPVAPRARRR